MPLADRPAWLEVVASQVGVVFDRFAAQNATLMMRTAAIIAVGEAADSTDPDVAEHRDRAHEATHPGPTCSHWPKSSPGAGPLHPVSAHKTPPTPSTD